MQNPKDAKKHQLAKAEELDLGSDESEEDSDEEGDSSRTPSEAEKLASLRAAAKAKRLALEKKQLEGAANPPNKTTLQDRIKEKRKRELEESSMASFLESSSASDESYRDQELDNMNVQDIDTTRVKRKENKISMSQSQSMTQVDAGSSANLQADDLAAEKQNTLRLGAEKEKKKPKIKEVDPYKLIQKREEGKKDTNSISLDLDLQS